MSWDGPMFIIAITAISTFGWLANNWIRARHGYDLEDEWGGKTVSAIAADTQRLLNENKDLRERLDQHGERIKVLERIVTDGGFDVGVRIEALREERAAQGAMAG